jgi:glycosyltransferase involved in cell wall biosynthesis
MPAPSITVLMPVYNGEKYLREAIDSILNQSFQNFEFLIINDGSTDKSEEIILSYTDPRIRYVKNEANLKLIASLNKGFDLALGKYVVRADADDTNHPERLRLQFEFMEQNPDVGLSGSGFETFGENVDSKTVVYAHDHNTICLKHLYQIHLSHGTSIFRMSVVRQHKLYFDPEFAHAEDYELWTRFSEVSKLANIPQVLYRVRHHEQEVSKLHSALQQENSMRIKQRQFKKMGIELSSAELQLFTQISQHEYLHSKSFIADVRNLLERLVTANNVSAVIDRPFFNRALANYWFNVTYNCSSLGLKVMQQYYQSPLSSLAKPSLLEKIKFAIKALTRK